MSGTINSIPSLGLGSTNWKTINGKLVYGGQNDLSTVDTSNAIDTPKVDTNIVNSTAFKTPEVTGETGMWDSITGAFKPGEGGHSTAGNMLKGASDAVGAIGGLGQLYFANKNYKLQKEQADYLKDREAKQDVRLGRFAANAGNGATY